MTGETPLISVVIPCRNRKDTLPACLDSVLGQSYQNLEVIVVDDGSTDGTEDLIREMPDERVRLIRYFPGKGACYARNLGASCARGSYIAFQDSDDIWHREKIEKQLRFLRSEQADFVFCAMNRTSIKGKQYRFPVTPFENGADAVGQFLMENRAGTQTMFMKREVWEDIRFDDTLLRYQDWDFALRTAAKWRMAYEPETLADSPVGKGSISSSVDAAPALEIFLEKHKEAYERYPDCLARMYRRMARRYRKAQPKRAAERYRDSYRIGRKVSDLAGYLFFGAAGIFAPHTKEEERR